MPKPQFSAADVVRLKQEQNLWLATIRPNSAPHLVPIWFVWEEDKAYLCTPEDSVKVRNLRQNPRVVFALEDGDDPIVVEGTAQILADAPPAVAEAFLDKYEWDIVGGADSNAVIEITPTRIVL